MSTLTFQPVADGLYQAVGDSSPAIAVYWVLLDGAPPSGNLDPQSTWTSYSGCHAFIPSDKPIADATAFVTGVRALFGAPASTARGLAWIADPANPAAAICVEGQIGSTPNVAITGGELVLPFGNLSFNASKDAELSYEASPTVAPGTPAIAIGAPARGGLVGLVRDGLTTNLLPESPAVVPLGGPSAGTVAFQANWERGELYAFFADNPAAWDTPPGAEVRFFYGAPGSEQTLRYPVLLGQSAGQGPAQALPLEVALDPLHPWDPGQTLLALDIPKFGGGGPTLPTCNTLATTDGGKLELTPLPGAGFALARRPQGASTEQADAYAYLTPTGSFAVDAGPGIRHLMCGLAATEYLLLAPGATVEFVPQGAAYAPSFALSPGGGGGEGADPCHPAGGDEPVDPADLLLGPYTTAWLRVSPPTAQIAPIDRGYAMQADSSVYYGSDFTAKYAYPLALGCRMSTLQPVSLQPPVPLPLAPYGDVWATGASTLPSIEALRAFESQIVAAARIATAPFDMTDGPTIFQPETHAPLDGGAAMTPDGLLATLNTAASGHPGTFAALQLAKSPNEHPLAEAGQLAFVGSPVMTPDVSYALLDDNLFMAATDGQALGGLEAGFKNLIQMGEWTFRLDVGYTDDQSTAPTTILLFKLTTAFSLFDLVDDTRRWQGWQTFIDREPAKAKAVQAQLNAMFCEAKTAGPNSLFADFLTKATDPNWTGVIAMNCGLDAADLPIDLQDLLGGIDGELRAHHFGVTVNRVHGDDSSSWEMQTSSLFALVHYEKAYTPPAQTSEFAFQVLRLNVLFENSTLAHFDSRIAVTIPELFSTEVVLPQAPETPAGYNVVEIDGVYQQHGDSGTVVFDTKQAQVFSFKTATSGFRVLQEAYVSDAALVPISSTNVQGVITVRSCLALAGTLVFVEDVSTAGLHANAPAASSVLPATRQATSLTTSPPALDLFAYGETKTSPPTGLGFESYAIAMTTVIAKNVGKITAIGPDLSGLRVTPATSRPRPNSILEALPMRLTSFLQQPPSSGWEVSFEGASDKSFNPTYALGFQASLGSLGALSSGSFEVELVLGWEAAKGSGSDQLWLRMVPPDAMRDRLGFGLEGVIGVIFTEIELLRTKWPTSGSPTWTVYALRFLNVNAELLGMPLLPGTGGFTLFANPAKGASSNIGWLMSFWSPIVPPVA